MSSRLTTLDDLRRHLNDAKYRLAAEKTHLLHMHDLPPQFNREEYAFAYVRAERLGMRSINRKLADIEWLPMQLDAKAEILGDHRAMMKRWLAAGDKPMDTAPDSLAFGNDFIHALARCGSLHGWDGDETLNLAARIANLFRDLSCLIGLAYYAGWLAEHGVLQLPLSAPGDLPRMAQDIAALLQSAEMSRLLRAREQDVEQHPSRRKALTTAPVKQKKPNLRVIENRSYTEPFLPDPATV